MSDVMDHAVPSDAKSMNGFLRLYRGHTRIDFVGRRNIWFAASVVIILVAAFSGFPHVGWLVVFLVIYRVFQDYVLNPYLLGSGIEMHPLLVLFGVLAGEQIAGIPGMFFSAPAMAAARVIYVRTREHRDAGV